MVLLELRYFHLGVLLGRVTSEAEKGRMGDGTASELDLRNDEVALFRLLSGLPLWRERASERIDYASTLLASRKKVIHVRPLRHILGDSPPEAKMSRVYLPVGLFPKRLFFDFDIRVNGAEVYRMAAEKNVKLLARYARQLAWVVNDREVRRDIAGGLIQPWLFAICEFRAGAWQQARKKYPKKESLLKYLQDGLCPRREDGSIDAHQLDAAVLEKWQAQVAHIGRAVRKHALGDVDSASENPLLVLPTLKANGIISDVDEVSGVVARLTKFLRRVEQVSADDAAARNFYEHYALMGRYWTVLVDCRVPLDEPFMIEVDEMRAVELGYRQSLARFFGSTFLLSRKDLGPLVSFNDASSNHVTVRVTDPNVDLGKGVEINPEAGKSARLILSMAQQKGEIVLGYSSAHRRPSVVHLKMTLRPAVAIRAIHWTVSLIVLFTGVSFLVAWNYVPGYFSAPHVAWLLTPSTFATSLLLARESSALSGGLAKNLRVLLAGALLLLWMLGFSLYLTDHLHLTEKSPAPRPSTSATSSRHTSDSVTTH
ncbi:hypothetical protein ACFV14_29130 [Streptomyces zaomyceticus]|uniref:hypothetical protein n=1 Tax=Streptomyces zaomyceticus TaxID=68286 RepID=UPI0036811156